MPVKIVIMLKLKVLFDSVYTGYMYLFVRAISSGIVCEVCCGGIKVLMNSAVCLFSGDDVIIINIIISIYICFPCMRVLDVRSLSHDYKPVKSCELSLCGCNLSIIHSTTPVSHFCLPFTLI